MAEKINFGLEIHQQLATHKLFCECYGEKTDNFDFSILRQMRASSGESGRIDAAAIEETKKRQLTKYVAKKDKICLVELDEEPPHLPNREALIIAAKIAKMFKMKIRKNVVFMRKIIVDGSNVSGFQRTALLATDGKLKTSFGEVGISDLFIEEDSAQRVGEENGKKVFSLHRAGIPLVEITTNMFTATPTQAKEVAEKIGSLLRMTGYVRRGLGTIRQDINMSLGKGRRVELKGVQNLDLIEKIIKIEIDRQKNLGNKLKSEVRQILPDGTTKPLRQISGENRMYPETDIPIFKFTEQELKDIQKYRLESFEEKLSRFKKAGLNDDLANQIIKSRDLFDFEKAIAKFKNIEPKKIAGVFVNIKKDAQRKLGKDIENKQIFEALDLLNHNKIVFPAIIEILTGKNPKDFEKITGKKLEQEIKKIIDKNKEAKDMGILMRELRLKADAKEVAEIYNKLKKDK